MSIIEISTDEPSEPGSPAKETAWHPYQDHETKKIRIFNERGTARVYMLNVRRRAKPGEAFRIATISTIRAAMLRAAKAA